MLDFNLVKQRFDEEAFKIIKDQLYFYDNYTRVLFEFRTKMKNYIQNNWSDFVFNCGLSNNCIYYKVQYNKEIPFGFETVFDLNLLEKTRFI